MLCGVQLFQYAAPPLSAVCVYKDFETPPEVKTIEHFAPTLVLHTDDKVASYGTFLWALTKVPEGSMSSLVTPPESLLLPVWELVFAKAVFDFDVVELLESLPGPFSPFVN
jgi:hypothetical protein